MPFGAGRGVNGNEYAGRGSRTGAGQTGAPMCGIIAVLRRPAERVDLEVETIVATLERGVRRVQDAAGAPAPDTIAAAAADLEQVGAALHGPRGVRFLLTDAAGASRVRGLAAALVSAVADLDAALDALVVDADTEARNQASIRVKDAAWAISSDRLRTADGVTGLIDRATGWSAVEVYTQIQQALSAIDRLEVRGRDSAGLLVLVRGHGLDPDEPAVAGLLEGRAADPLLRSGAVRIVETADGEQALAFAYKAAAEIGELGDNTAALRSAIAGDGLLRLAVSADDGLGGGARPHPLGQRRHHLRGQRPPARLRRGPAGRSAPSWPLPSTATSTTSPI